MSRMSAQIPADPLRRVRSGSGTLIARAGITVLLADDDAARARAVWDAAGSDQPVDEVIEVLARGGLRSMPHVIIVATEGPRLRLIVRGAAIAEVLTGSGGGERVVMDGSNVRSWSESTVEDWLSYSLRIGESSPATDGGQAERETFVSVGIVPAQEVSYAGADSAVAAEAGALIQSAVSQPDPNRVTDLPVADQRVDDELVAGLKIDPVADVSDGPDAQSSTDQSGTGQSGAGQSGAGKSGTGQSSIAESSTDQSGAEQSGSTGVGPGFGENHASQQPDTDVAEDDEVEDAYGEMFGMTVMRDVQNAAVASVEDDHTADPDHTGDDDHTGDPDSASDPGAPDEKSDAASADHAQSDALANHTRPLADLEAARREGEPDDDRAQFDLEGDHDGHTVSLTQLRRMRAQQKGATPAAAAAHDVDSPALVGPTVQAILCELGHANPVYAETCRECEGALTGATVVVARPSMGRLRSSTGETIELDRPVIVGRKPSVTGRRVSEIPFEWQIAEGDGLSRNHALFHIDGWQVRVEDLGSVNSTTVTLPGREPTMLRAGEPVLITDGAIIDLGGEVTCTYDASV